MSAMTRLIRELGVGLDESLVELRRRMGSNTAAAADYALYTQVLLAKIQIKQELDANPTC